LAALGVEPDTEPEDVFDEELPEGEFDEDIEDDLEDESDVVDDAELRASAATTERSAISTGEVTG
jgi:hypothetical protein